MDIEPLEDYIVSPEAIVATVQIDEMVGDSRGKMNRLDERRKANDRVRGAITLRLSQVENAS